MTIQFPDVSHYQSGLSLKGAPAVIAKATQGSTYRDPAYAGFKAQAAAFGIPSGAYHWPDTSDLAAQAHNAFAVIGSSTAVMWDAEAAGATVPRLLELTSRYRALGGVAKLCYLPHWWWQQIGSPDLRPLAAAGLSLVSSSYPSAGYTDSGPGWAAYGGVTPVIWQYTSTQSFNGQRIDFNAYRGSADQLRALLGAGPTTTQEDDMRVFTWGGGMWVSGGSTRRSIPNGSALNDITARATAGVEKLDSWSAARIDECFGPDVASLKGVKGDPGPATLVPHTHPVGSTGDAAAS